MIVQDQDEIMFQKVKQSKVKSSKTRQRNNDRTSDFEYMQNVISKKKRETNFEERELFRSNLAIIRAAPLTKLAKRYPLRKILTQFTKKQTIRRQVLRFYLEANVERDSFREFTGANPNIQINQRSAFRNYLISVVREGFRIVEEFLIGDCKIPIKPIKQGFYSAMVGLLHLRTRFTAQNVATFHKFVTIGFNLDSVTVTQRQTVRFYTQFMLQLLRQLGIPFHDLPKISVELDKEIKQNSKSIVEQQDYHELVLAYLHDDTVGFGKKYRSINSLQSKLREILLVSLTDLCDRRLVVLSQQQRQHIVYSEQCERLRKALLVLMFITKPSQAQITNGYFKWKKSIEEIDDILKEHDEKNNSQPCENTHSSPQVSEDSADNSGFLSHPNDSM